MFRFGMLGKSYKVGPRADRYKWGESSLLMSRARVKTPVKPIYVRRFIGVKIPCIIIKIVGTHLTL